MDLERAAKQLGELGQATRLSVFRELVRAGHVGLSVGELKRGLDVPASTLSHHIARLVSVGLIRQVREGRTLYCLPELEAMEQLLDFLSSECCARERRQEHSVIG